MKLLIYETTHHETLPAILDLSEKYFGEITVFLREFSYDNLCGNEKPENRWRKAVFFKQPPGYSNRSFAKDGFALLKRNNYTHLHISTLDNNLLYFAWQICLTKKISISLSVQAINEYCAYRFGNFRDITESVAKLFLHRRIRHHRVFFPLMTDILQQRLPGSIVVFIPSRFYLPGKAIIERSSGSFRIVIPGSVDPNRRDYNFVLSFLKEFLPQYANAKPLELVILGNSNTEYGKKLVAALQTFESPGFKPIHYNGYIPQAEYEKQLSLADVLWSPIQLHTLGIRKTAEVYGISTATGLTADLLLNEKPVLVPHGFQAPEHYEDALINYSSSNELIGLLNAFTLGIDEEISKKISQSFSFFRKENFETFFCKLMEIAT